MNRSYMGGLMLGLVCGVALTGAVFLIARPRPAREAPEDAKKEAPKESALLAERSRKLEEENAELRKKVETLEGCMKDMTKVAPPTESSDAVPASPIPEDPAISLRQRFSDLAKKGLMALRSPEFQKLQEDFRKAGPEGVRALSDLLLHSQSAQERFMAGMILENIKDPSANPALIEALKGDKDDLVRRMASHALAVNGGEGSVEALRAAVNGDSDWGVRVNSSYGLAKQGEADGVKLLEQFYLSEDTPAEARVGILYGLADVADPSSAPLLRKILSDTKDMSYLIVAISGLEKMKDTASIPDLRQLANSDVPDNIKEAALKAIEEIQK